MTSVMKRIVAICLFCVPMAVMSSLALRHDLFSKVVVTPATLPDIPGWKSQDAPLTQAELSMLDSPASCQRIYTDAAGDSVQILVLQVSDTQNAHDPKLCMEGSGYTNPEDKVVPAPWLRSQDVSRALFKKDQSTVTMYYWLQTPQGTVADLSAGFKWEGIKRAFTGSTVRGIAVRVIAQPNLGNDALPTDPKTAADLWKSISDKVHFDKLVSEIG
jgi:EpsI family protein